MAVKKRDGPSWVEVMKRVVWMLSLVVFIAGCGVKSHQVDALMNRITGQGDGPVLDKMSDPAFHSYIYRFENDFFRMTGHSIDARTVAINFDQQYFQKKDRSDMLGVCLSYGDQAKEILVNPRYWPRLSETSKKYLIYHEMGHCKLGREHDDSKQEGTPLSMMTTYIISDASFQLYEDEYLFELFTGNNDQIEHSIEMEALRRDAYTYR